MSDASSNGHRERPRAPSPVEKGLSKRPYRDAAIIHACFAMIIVVVALLTGGLLKGLAVAAGYYVLATGYSWFQLRRRIRLAESRAVSGE